MKSKLKILIFALMLTAIINPLATVAFADGTPTLDTVPTEDSAKTAETPAENGIDEAAEGSGDVHSDSGDGTDSVENGTKADTPEGVEGNNTDRDNSPEAEENPFTALFAQVKEYATEIFCALTFIGSMLLAYAYKKGLLPLVEGTLVSIGNAVTKIKEKTEQGEERSNALGDALTQRLACAEELISGLAQSIDTMNTSLCEVKACEDKKTADADKLSLIVSTQIDMLYDIFMTSALPQYQKDAVGERVAKMKEALTRDAVVE